MLSRRTFSLSTLGQIDFKRDAEGLHVRLPDARSREFAHGLRIRGRGLV